MTAAKRAASDDVAVGHPIMQLEGLTVSYSSPVVRDVNLSVLPGECVGIVGESGSGKSTVALSLLKLLPADAHVSGAIYFHGEDILEMHPASLDKVRGPGVGIVLQESLSALDPLMRVGRQISEGPRLHLGMAPKEAAARSLELLNSLGVPDAARCMEAYPHELSGGMRQRVALAIALSCDPELLIADEATTALDVTVQAQIIELVKRLSAERRMSLVWISHDLGVIAALADRVYVMYRGLVVEQGLVKDVYSHPLHPYTRDLLGVIEEREELLRVDGHALDLDGAESNSAGPRCPYLEHCIRAVDECRIMLPHLEEKSERHWARCFNPAEAQD